MLEEVGPCKHPGNTWMSSSHDEGSGICVTYDGIRVLESSVPGDKKRASIKRSFAEWQMGSISESTSGYRAEDIRLTASWNG